MVFPQRPATRKPVGKAKTKRPREYIVLLLVVILFFLALSILFTRPVLTQGSHATVRDPFDPTFQAWTIGWDLRALSHNPWNLFNANILFPNRYTLAYNDAQITNALMSIPIMAISDNPVLAQNYMLIFNFFLCALGAYFLVSHLTGNRLAGVAGGMIFAFAPPRIAHLGHLNLTSAGWMPLSLLFLHRYSEEGKARDAALFALFFVLQALTTWHYAIILSVAVVVFLLVRLAYNYRAFTKKWCLVFLAAALVGGILLTPFLLPYLKVQKLDPRFSRDVDEVQLFSADIQDFAAAPAENLVWGRAFAGARETAMKRGGPTERTLFPGLMALVLGVSGAALLFARGKGKDRFSAWYYSVLTGVSFVLCFGVTLYLFGHRFNVPMPYRLLYYIYPGFKAMRVPPRFIILIVLSLAVLSGFAVKALVTWVTSKRGTAAGAAVSLGIIALLMLDLMTVSISMYRVPLKAEFPPVYQWLKEQEGEAPTVEMPLADYHPDTTFKWGLQYEPTWSEREAPRTYYSVLHWKKILNGYNSFIPTSYYDAVRACADFPSEAAFDYLRKQGIEYVIVHGDQLGPEKLARVLEWSAENGDITLVKQFGNDYAYRLER